MTPRPHVPWVDLNSPREQVLSEIRSCPHAQLLVCRGSIDEVVGIVRKQDVADQFLKQARRTGTAMRAPLILHESTTVLRTLDLFRKTPVHTAIVVDEFGALKASSPAPTCWRPLPALPKITPQYGQRSQSARTAHT